MGDAQHEPPERYDHNANNVTGTCPIDWENDLVPIEIWKSQQAEIERLVCERDNLQATLDRRNGLRSDCKLCGDKVPFVGAVFCSEDCATQCMATMMKQ